MLDDENRGREAGGQAGDERLQGTRPAGRGGDHHALGRGDGDRPRVLARRAGAGPHPGPAERADLGHELLGEAQHAHGLDGRLVHEVHGPELEPPQGDLGPHLGQGGHQQDGHRLLGHEALEGLEPSEPRHLDVERDHVGPQLAGLGEALLAVGREAHHLDVVHRPEHPLDGLADERGIVDHEDADPAAPGHGRSSSGFWYTIAPWKRIGTKALETRASDSAWPRKR